jgi:hypothetical protein
MNNVFTIFFGAFSFIYYYRNSLFKALIAPFIILVLLAIAEHAFELTKFWAILLMAIDLLIYTLLAVTTHRIVLLGEDSVPEWGFRKISMREVWFLIHTVGIGLLLIAPGLLIYIPYVGWILALILITLLLGRLSLVFPAIATGQKWSFHDSWAATRDHQLMMAIIVAVLPIIVALPTIALVFIPNTEIPIAVLSLFTTVFCVVTLSLAFKIVRDEDQAH